MLQLQTRQVRQEQGQGRARAEADATHGDTKLMLLQDRTKAEADATHRGTGVARNTSDSCWSARELLEAKEREQLLQLQASQARHEQG